MTSTLGGMDRDRHAAVRALLIRQALATTSPTATSRTAPTAPAAGAAYADDPERTGGPVVRRPVWRRPQLALTSAGGLLAAGLAIVAVVTVSRPVPAYAVTGGNGKAVTVTVNRLEGASALETALRTKGIAADVTYLPSGQACQQDRYIDHSVRGMSLGVGTDSFEVTIPAGAVGQGQLFVLSASVTPLPQRSGFSAAVYYGIADGPVAPCIPADLAPDGSPSS